MTVRAALGHNPWLVRPLPGRGELIAGITLHSTRSGASDDEYDDGPGTERWGMHPDNGSAAQGWGTFWDRLIWRDGTRLICTDVDREYASWTAGFGNVGPPTAWALGHYYVQIELSQSRPDQPFSDASIEELAKETGELSRRYDFPIVRIPFVTQQENPKPRGITTHEGSANGVKLGKSDPGDLFPWATFTEKAQAYKSEGDPMSEDKIRSTILDWSQSDDFGEAVLAAISTRGYKITTERLNHAIVIRERVDAAIARLMQAGSSTELADVETTLAAINTVLDDLANRETP